MSSEYSEEGLEGTNGLVGQPTGAISSSFRGGKQQRAHRDCPRPQKVPWRPPQMGKTSLLMEEEGEYYEDEEEYYDEDEADV